MPSVGEAYNEVSGNPFMGLAAGLSNIGVGAAKRATQEQWKNEALRLDLELENAYNTIKNDYYMSARNEEPITWAQAFKRNPYAASVFSNFQGHSMNRDTWGLKADETLDMSNAAPIDVTGLKNTSQNSDPDGITTYGPKNEVVGDEPLYALAAPRLRDGSVRPVSKGRSAAPEDPVALGTMKDYMDAMVEKSSSNVGRPINATRTDMVGYAADAEKAAQDGSPVQKPNEFSSVLIPENAPPAYQLTPPPGLGSPTTSSAPAVPTAPAGGDAAKPPPGAPKTTAQEAAAAPEEPAPFEPTYPSTAVESGYFRPNGKAIMVDPSKQGSPEWLKARGQVLGGTDASYMFGDQWDKNQSDSYSKFVTKEAGDRQDLPSGSVSTPATEWGNKMEAVASEAYAKEFPGSGELKQIGLMYSNKSDDVGTSLDRFTEGTNPDGTKSIDSIISVKAPYSGVIPRKPDAGYVRQLQAEMENSRTKKGYIYYWTPEGTKRFEVSPFTDSERKKYYDGVKKFTDRIDKRVLGWTESDSSNRRASRTNAVIDNTKAEAFRGKQFLTDKTGGIFGPDPTAQKEHANSSGSANRQPGDTEEGLYGTGVKYYGLVRSQGPAGERITTPKGKPNIFSLASLGLPGVGFPVSDKAMGTYKDKGFYPSATQQDKDRMTTIIQERLDYMSTAMIEAKKKYGPNSDIDETMRIKKGDFLSDVHRLAGIYGLPVDTYSDADFEEEAPAPVQVKEDPLSPANSPYAARLEAMSRQAEARQKEIDKYPVGGVTSTSTTVSGSTTSGSTTSGATNPAPSEIPGMSHGQVASHSASTVAKMPGDPSVSKIISSGKLGYNESLSNIQEMRNQVEKKRANMNATLAGNTDPVTKESYNYLDRNGRKALTVGLFQSGFFKGNDALLQATRFINTGRVVSDKALNDEFETSIVNLAKLQDYESQRRRRVQQRQEAAIKIRQTTKSNLEQRRKNLAAEELSRQKYTDEVADKQFKYMSEFDEKQKGEELATRELLTTQASDNAQSMVDMLNPDQGLLTDADKIVASKRAAMKATIVEMIQNRDTRNQIQLIAQAGNININPNTGGMYMGTDPYSGLDTSTQQMMNLAKVVGAAYYMTGDKTGGGFAGIKLAELIVRLDKDNLVPWYSGDTKSSYRLIRNTVIDREKWKAFVRGAKKVVREGRYPASINAISREADIRSQIPGDKP